MMKKKAFITLCLLSVANIFAGRTQVYVGNFTSEQLLVKPYSPEEGKLSPNYWDVNDYLFNNRVRYGSNGVYCLGPNSILEDYSCKQWNAKSGELLVFEADPSGLGVSFPILDISRTTGITNGKTFYVNADIYYTKPRDENKKIIVKVKLVGTLLGSNIWWSVSVPGGAAVGHTMGDWFTDHNSRTIKFSDGGKKFKVEFSGHFTFGYDDLSVMFLEDKALTAEPATQELGTQDEVFTEPDVVEQEPEVPESEQLISAEPAAPDDFDSEQPVWTTPDRNLETSEMA